MTAIRCLRANSRIDSISQGQPARCTATMAFVRDVITLLIVSAVRLLLSRSMSATTGVAPRMTAQLADAINVLLGTTTSSPGPIPRQYTANSRATVPFASAIAYLHPGKRGDRRE